MIRKLMGACLSLAALAALALPAAASATNDPQLTDNGSLIPVGTNIVGTNVGEVKFLNTPATQTLANCNKAQLTGSLLKNSGGTFEITFSTRDFWGTGALKQGEPLPECTATFGNAPLTVTQPLCLRSNPTMLTDEFQLGSDCPTSGPFKFAFDSTGSGNCEYETAGPLKGDYKTSPSENELTTRSTSAGGGASLISGGFLCPSSGIFAMTVQLETEDGTKLTIS